ncbi:MAG: alpha/beta hydrolase-fold protein [Thermoanaerobaculia bacterium]|nr:alpha/beta hydrolase-fold protein [Thermoanaerobaculia bacterium]
MKRFERVASAELGEEVGVARWGHFGAPVLLFPTAGGDAEEAERFKMLHVLEPLLAAGRVKIYSCDSVAGRAWTSGEGSGRRRSAIQSAFDRFVYRELVPWIRADCDAPEIEVVTAGASIGAFNALAAICRHPDVFSTAVCMSGTYDLTRWLDDDWNDDFYFSSPLHFVPGLPEGPVLDALRRRFVVLATGEGRWEAPHESWWAAKVLGAKGIPNRVDPWGRDWDHDWRTWRAMLPHYLDQIARD